MIFVTVGTQLPFDRLVLTVDHWAAQNPNVKVFAQIGPHATAPKSIQYSELISPGAADDLSREAELIVAHAGMGSILTALKYQRPIFILPRKAELGEHRNDHQMATAKWLASRRGISVAWKEEELPAMLSKRGLCEAGDQLAEFAKGHLIEKLFQYMNAK